MTNILTTRNIYFAYNEYNKFSFPDISCHAGEHCLVMGASGCGKTTLLHLIAGLICPNKGEIIVNNTDLTRLTPSKVDKIRGREIGIVFQTPHFIQSLTVEENLLIVLYMNGLTHDPDLIEKLLVKLGIADKRNVLPNKLSQGEMQRLSIARAVINKPFLILADEPTSSLDDKNCEEALVLLKEQAEMNNAALLIVTHDHRLYEHFQHIVQL